MNLSFGDQRDFVEKRIFKTIKTPCVYILAIFNFCALNSMNSFIRFEFI